MLNEAQVAQYHEAGYVVPEYRLSEDALTEIKAAGCWRASPSTETIARRFWSTTSGS